MNTLPELTNLLPAERTSASRRGYFVRLGVVVLFVMAGVVLVSGALLAPAYLFAHQQVAARNFESAQLAANLAGSEEQAVNVRVTTLTSAAKYLSALGTQATASNVIVALTKLPRPGITLSGFVYTAATSGAAATMAVSGTATDRDSLRRYVALLSALPFVSSADLPISAYAKETNIDFTVQLTGSLKP